MFELNEANPKEANFGSGSYQEAREIEGSKNRDSSVTNLLDLLACELEPSFVSFASREPFLASHSLFSYFLAIG